MVKIFDITEGSKAQEEGILPGDYLVAVNGHQIEDVLDYSFYMAARRVHLRLYRNDEMYDVYLTKGQYDDIGLNFETFLMDKQRSCRNKCIFCFIDQLPEGLRPSLYFKDDDSRMSFISGSYITLTNMSEHDIERIILMKTSPINISVHTTNPELRVKMLCNRFAGNVLEVMRRFAAANITMNCQIVLCRSVNDGAELDRTMRDLGELYPAVNSVSVVPAGLTKYREEKGLYPLAPFSPEECRQVIRQVEAFSEEFYKAYGSHFVYCGDEFYVKGGVQLHTGEYYDGYPQLANGVGMMTSMYEDFSDALAAMDLSEYQPERPREVSIATGKAAYELICVMANALCARCPGLKCHVYAIRNDFFGDNITVSGLLTGQDIAAQLRRMPLGERLLLPANTLRFERDLFLDGMTPKELSEKLMVPVEFTENDGRSFIETVLK